MLDPQTTFLNITKNLEIGAYVDPTREKRPTHPDGVAFSTFDLVGGGSYECSCNHDQG